ncbi:unnamed protein product [Auanema sp. JU1783]|nr:unnamed protein product [Auanema sp. JU1783]
MSASKKAVVVVLGDIGRSPRMCYHSYSLAEELKYDVTIIGYLDTRPHLSIDTHPKIQCKGLSAPPDFLNKLPGTMQLGIKFIWTFFQLFWVFLVGTSLSLDLILLQNPPAIPTMLVCWMMARLKGAKFVIDWHNYMYTVMLDKWKMGKFDISPEPSQENETTKEMAAIKKKFGKDVPMPHSRKKKPNEKKEKKSTKRRIVELVHKWEGYFGRLADGSLCVTRAMRENLLSTWGVRAAVLYDRPPSWSFGQIPDDLKHDLFMRLGSTPEGKVFRADFDNECNHFTKYENGDIFWNTKRPMILISSTSWTPDEDFSILLDAAIKYNDVARLCRNDSEENYLPSLLMVITGRGEEKEYYLDRIKRLNLEKVEFLTPWLEAEDYPKMLASSDLGVSLHTSTSGLDLPMKAVDMLGSGIPVLAKRFDCIGELIEDGHNGHLFDNSTELFRIILSMATGFPNHSYKLNQLKINVYGDKLPCWEETWRSSVVSVVSPERNIHFERVLADEPLTDDDVDD